MSLVLQESLGSTVEKPIKVRWSANFAHEYEPHDFVERVEESRLSRAELIEIRVADESISATVKFSGLKGEPGAELAVVGPGHEEQFASLKEAVELGEWRPISSERLVLVAAATAYLIFLPALMVSPSPNSMLLSLLAGLGLGTVFGLVALAYVAAANFAIRSLMPPLEIRRAGIQSFDILTTTLKWAIAVVPAMFAIAAGVSRWIG